MVVMMMTMMTSGLLTTTSTTTTTTYELWALRVYGSHWYHDTSYITRRSNDTGILLPLLHAMMADGTTHHSSF